MISQRLKTKLILSLLFFLWNRMMRLACCTVLLFLFRLILGLPWYQVLPAIVIFYLGSGGYKFLHVFMKTVGRDLQ